MPDEGSQNSSGDGGEEAIRRGNSLRTQESTKLGACAVRAPLRPHARASIAMLRVLSISPEPLRLRASALKKQEKFLGAGGQIVDNSVLSFNAEALSREVFLRFWSSLQLTFGEFADNHSASRGCD